MADLLGIERRSKNSDENGIVNPEYQKLKYGKLDYSKRYQKFKVGKLSTDEITKSGFSKHKYAFMLEAPFEISNKCCNYLKKNPAHKYSKQEQRVGITAQMAAESMLRTSSWLKNGCNSFDAINPISNPLSFWTEQDILEYIYTYKIPICSVYGEVVKNNGKFSTTKCDRTGCVLCGFGCHLENEPNRFQKLSQTHPTMYKILDVAKNNGITYRQALDWINNNDNNKFNIKY